MVIREKHQSQRSRRAAFTLMELMIVVALLVILAGTGGFYYMRALESGKKQAAKAGVTSIEKQVQMWAVEHGSQMPPSLQSLAVGDDVNPKPQMSQKDLTDPWGKPYQYDPNGTRNQGNKPDVWTQAPDQTVIGNW
jgi:general secretion pathway protein G